MNDNKNIRKILIPLYTVIILYIIYMNITPFGGTTEHKIDIGEESDMKKDSAYLAGPLERITGPLTEGQTNYRDLTHSLVYFNLPANSIYPDSGIELKIRYKVSPANSTKILLGGKDTDEWHYRYMTLYNPSDKYLQDHYPHMQECSAVYLYSTENIILDCPGMINSLGSALYPNEPVLAKNFDKSRAMTTYEPSGKNSTLFNYSLRGDHTFYTYINNNKLDLKIQKYDQNWYNGSDVLNIRIYGPDNALFANLTIEDDSIGEKTGESGPIQEESYHFTAQKGTYRIVLDDLSVGADVITKSIEISSGKLVFENRIFTLDPSEFHTKAVLPSEIRFTTYHEPFTQDIYLDNRIVSVDNPATTYTAYLMEGARTITIPKGDIIMQSDNYYSPDADSYFEPYRYSFRDYDTYMSLLQKNNTQITETVIAETGNQTIRGELINTLDFTQSKTNAETPFLRGSHTFYTYVKTSPLNVEISKKDRNGYEGEDILEIEIFDRDNNIIYSDSIKDDGNTQDNTIKGKIQEKTLTLEIKEGIYKIVLISKSHGSDFYAKIKTNQQKLVMPDNMFVIDPAELTLKTHDRTNITFRTYHTSSYQKINIDNKIIDIKNTSITYTYELKPGTHNIKIPKGDMIIKTSAIISFTPEAHFNPYEQISTATITRNLTIGTIPRFILTDIPCTPPKKDSDWLISTVEFKGSDLYIKNNELGFLFNTPDIKNNTVSIDWIEAKITVPPIWKR